MTWNQFLTKMRRYEDNAMVIFDDEEPVGRPTDLVMPYKRWFGRTKKSRLIKRLGGVAERER